MDCGRVELRVGNSGIGRYGNAYSHLAHGGHEHGPGDLDRRLPDFLGRLSGDIAIDVDHRRRPTGRNVAGIGAGVFVLLVFSHDGRGDGLYPFEVTSREGRESGWRVAD